MDLEDIEYGLLTNIASKMSVLAGRLVASSDYAQLIVHILQTLEGKGQKRELAIMHYLMNYKMNMWMGEGEGEYSGELIYIFLYYTF